MKKGGPVNRPTLFDPIIPLRSDHHFIYIAPTPTLSWLKGLDDRVIRGVKVRSGMAIGGTVAATHMTADEAKTQMDPAIPGFQTFLTALGTGRHLTNLIGMGTTHDQFSFRFDIYFQHINCVFVGHHLWCDRLRHTRGDDLRKRSVSDCTVHIRNDSKCNRCR
jgi:hypothetical protein